MSFCIYGLGSTGKSAAKYLKSRNFHNIKIWDDKKKTKTGKKAFGSIPSEMEGAKLGASVVFFDLGITDAITDKHRTYSPSFTIPVN